MSELGETVECDKHGTGSETFVCQHLADGQKLGFFCDDTSDDPRPDAWCGDCDGMMMAHGEWNEEIERSAGITLRCANCYDEVRRRNSVREVMAENGDPG